MYSSAMLAFGLLSALAMAGCSEAGPEKEQAVAPTPPAAQAYISDPETEAAVAAKARTLEEAADEAVRLLASEYDQPPPELTASEVEAN